MRLERLGAFVFAAAGGALTLFGIYIAGQDAASCTRLNGRVDCAIARTRVLGFADVERLTTTDVVDAFARESTTPDSSATLVLRTRDGRSVDTLVSAQSGDYANRIAAMVKAQTATPVAPGTTAGDDFVVQTHDELVGFRVEDGYWPIAAACGIFGLVLLAFAGLAFRDSAAKP